VLVAGILFVFVTSFLLVVRPYRVGVYNIIDSVILLSVILACFSAAGSALISFNRRYEAFVIIMFGIGALSPPVYAILLLIKTITPKNLLAITKRCLLRLILCGKNEREQRSESIEEPLLGDSAESQLTDDEELRYNSLLNYTKS
jgi:hypothetical protein